MLETILKLVKWDVTLLTVSGHDDLTSLRKQGKELVVEMTTPC